jgi:hypothetical protein
MPHRVSSVGALFALAILSASAQWLNHPNPGTPRLPDGKPNLSAKTPRAPNGRPNLSRVWHTEFAPPGENERLFGHAIKNIDVPGDTRGLFEVLSEHSRGLHA